MVKTHLAIIAAALAAFLLAACSGTTGRADPTANASSPASARSSPRVPTAPAGLAVVVDGQWTSSSPTAVSPTRAILVGPHSVLQLDTIARTREIDGGSGTEVPNGITLPIAAAKGHELVLAHIAPTDVQPELASGDTQSSAKATVVVGTQVRHLDGTTEGDSTLIISAPIGAPVHLRMNDGGRPQDLDLRTGRRVRSASPLYYPQVRADIKDVPTFGLWPNPNKQPIVIMSQEPDAELSPYTDRHGWAHPGRAWLIVDFPIRIDDGGQSAGAQITAKSLGLTVTLPDGSTARGTWSHTAPSSLATGISDEQITGVLAVPASLRSARLTIAPPVPFSTGGKHLSGPLHAAIRFHR